MPTIVKFATSKTGAAIGTISRPVGPSCPTSCPFLNNGCYAERIQARRPNVRDSWRRNYGLTSAQWRRWSAELAAELMRHVDARRIRALRIHIGGDFGRRTRRRSVVIDRPYVAAILRAFRALRAAGRTLPAWFYTHLWRELAPHRPYFARLAVQAFASVHSLQEAREATDTGYRVAYASPVRKTDAKRYRVKLEPDARIPMCPEQIGTKPDCGSCGYCFSATHKGGIAFAAH